MRSYRLKNKSIPSSVMQGQVYSPPSDELEDEKKQTFLGTAYVRTDHLQFDCCSRLRSHLDVKNTNRLRRAFALEKKVRPAAFGHHIPGIIDERDFTAALCNSKLTRAQLRHSDEIPGLILPSDSKIVCLRGKYRLEAARKLSHEPTWWAVDLFPTGW